MMQKLINNIINFFENNLNLVLKKLLLKLFVRVIYYFLIFLGFFSLFLLIYFSFIRERLPRDIPFTLTEFKFYVLIFICFSYFYIIKSTLYPKIPHHVVLSILNKITTPFYYFFNALVGLSFIGKINDKLILKLIVILDSWFDITFAFFIYFTQLLPRIILLSIFIIDVFWLHKIEVFYYCILLSVFPLLYNFFMFYINYSLEDLITYLEKRYDYVLVVDQRYLKSGWEPDPLAIYHDTKVPIRKYLDIQYETFKNFIDNDIDIEYEGDAYSTEACYEDYKKTFNKTKLTLDDYDYLTKDFNFYMPKIIKLKIFKETFYKTTPTEFYIPQVKLFIIIAYLITWFYILCVSIHTLHDLPLTLNILTILSKYSNINNPFIDI